MKIGGFNLRSFSRTSTESTHGGESAHTAPAHETNPMMLGAAVHAVGEGDREAIPAQPPSGTRPAEVERFLDQAALSAIEFQTPDLERYDTIDRAAESVKDFTRDLFKHSPTFRKAVREATGAGTAKPSRIRMVQGKLSNGLRAYFHHTDLEVRTDPRHPEFKKSPNRLLGIAAFEMFNGAAQKPFGKIKHDAISDVYEQQAQYSKLTSAQLYARDTEYQEWLNLKEFYRALVEAKTDGMHIPPGADVWIEKFGTAERPGPWADFKNYYAEQLATGHTQLYIDRYYVLHPRTSTRVNRFKRMWNVLPRITTDR